MDAFLDRYRFDPEKAGFWGIELEMFLSAHAFKLVPVPRSDHFLELARLQIDGQSWGPELSACQVEWHTVPVSRMDRAVQQLSYGVQSGALIARSIGENLYLCEVAPEDMDLSVYPGNPRYAVIAEKLPVHVLRAACQVAGTHIHMGVGSWEEAFAVHNALCASLPRFLQMGDHSNGERIRLYSVMAKETKAPMYESVDHYWRVAEQQGFVNDPRGCYHFVRINPVGTVEVRAFGIPERMEEVVYWIESMQECVRDVRVRV